MTDDLAELAAERVGRLITSGMVGFWLFDPAKVNGLELSNMRPGQLIKAQDMNAVRFVPADTQGLEGCVAGWISEEES